MDQRIFNDLSRRDWVVADKLGAQVPEIIKNITIWYRDIVERRFDNAAIVYSPIRRTFVQKLNLPFKVEDYCSSNELCALVRIIGPCGIQLIDRQILYILKGHFDVMKVR